MATRIAYSTADGAKLAPIIVAGLPRRKWKSISLELSNPGYRNPTLNHSRILLPSKPHIKASIGRASLGIPTKIFAPSIQLQREGGGRGGGRGESAPWPFFRPASALLSPFRTLFRPTLLLHATLSNRPIVPSLRVLVVDKACSKVMTGGGSGGKRGENREWKVQNSSMGVKLETTIAPAPLRARHKGKHLETYTQTRKRPWSPLKAI